MSDPPSTTDCPLCGAKVKELDQLIMRMNDVAAAHLRSRRIERAVTWALVVCNVAFFVYFIATR